MKSNFFKFINKYAKTNGIILEEGPSINYNNKNDNFENTINNSNENNDIYQTQPEESALPEKPILVPEEKVLLVRLIFKALVMNLDPSQTEELLEIGGGEKINEKNVNKILNKLQSIMNSNTSLTV